MNYENPLIVQSDRSLLLDVHAPRAEECRNALIPFAELEKSPEHLHTYKLSPLSLWNAASAGFSADDAIAVLHEFARYDVPQSIEMWIKENASRFGRITLVKGPDIAVNRNGENITAKDDENKEIVSDNEKKENEDKTVIEHYLYLVTDSLPVFKEIGANASVKKYLTSAVAMEDENAPEHSFLLKLTDRGTIKQLLLQAGWQ